MGIKKLHSIRTITFLFIGIAITILAVAYTNMFIGNMYNLLSYNERDHMQQQGRIALGILEASVNNANAITRDWSSWDETYSYALGQNPNYTTDTLTEYPFLLHNFNFAIIKNLENETLFLKFYNIETGEEMAPPEGISNYMNILLDDMLGAYNEDKTYSFQEEMGKDGFFFYDDVCYYVCSLPILTTDETSHPAGTFTFGRIIDSAEIARITNSDGIDFSVISTDSEEIKSYNLQFENLQAYFTDKSNIHYFKKHKDYFGNESIVLHTTKNRDVYNKGSYLIIITSVAMVVGMLIFAFIILFVLNRYIIQPIKNLSDEVKNMNANTTSLSNVSFAGCSEFFTLFTSINDMLHRLAHNRISLENSNISLKIYKEAINSASDEIIISSADNMIEYVNPSTLSNMDYNQEEMIGKPVTNFLLNRKLMDTIMKSIKKGDYWKGELYFVSREGEQIVNEVSITPILDTEGNLLRITFIKRNIQEKKKYENLLMRAAHSDSLTGLPNRYDFYETLYEAIMNARTYMQKVIVLFFDLDRFKTINDSIGHSAGDQIIKETAKRIREELGDLYTARMGDDEFTVIIRDVKNVDEADLHANRVMKIFKEPFYLYNREIKITVSMGSSVFPDDATDGETLMKNADTAMHAAKTTGRNMCVPFSKKLSDKILQRVSMEQRMQKAIQEKEFLPYFQPKVYSKDKKIFGFEALARWRSKEGMVMPNDFIPLAEETGLIVPISWIILRESCKCNQMLVDAGYDTKVSVNMTAQGLLHQDFFAILDEIKQETGMDIKRLDIEITESELITDIESINTIFKRLSEMGVSISVDDFGTGYSSLSYLKKLNVDRIKIDRSFIKDLPNESDSVAIVDAVIAMSKSLGLLITSEGVETLEQFEYLREKACDEIQGYYIKPPVPFEELKQLMLSEF